jgi:carbon-monoxide dehydrogenase small subunit
MTSKETYLEEGKKKVVKLVVNGEMHEVLVSPQRTLLEVVRNELGFTGTKHACGTGECGACTVLIDGKPMLSCLTLAADLEGREIVTIEGVSQGEELHPIQQSFVENGAIQCGYCTPGFVLMAKALLDEDLSPTEDDVRWHLRGNLCRCTGYVKIVEATMKAARKMRGGKKA